MNDTTKKWALLAVRVLLTIGFLGAGWFKLSSNPMAIQEFDTVGLGQWFRYVTGIIEVGSAILLWVPGLTAVGAGLQVCVALGAILAHLTKLGMATSPPVIVLGLLAALTLYVNRSQLNR